MLEGERFFFFYFFLECVELLCLDGKIAVILKNLGGFVLNHFGKNRFHMKSEVDVYEI